MAVVLAALWAIMPGPADAQSYTAVRPGGRAGTWEFTLPLLYADSARISGQNGTSVDINSGYGFGFGFGYNFTDNFQLNGLFNWNSRTYDATTVNTDGTTRKYSNYVDTSTISLNGVYYFMNGDFTPFVSGGVGITYVDTNIPTGSGSTSCWYDPWWGYVCSSYVPTKTENDISYNAGVGVRFEANRQFALQFGYYKTWIDVSRASSTPDFDIWKLDFIFRM
ncbi:MAG: outer membrane beta-barrel protein [Nitrospirae bacterium]|nr:outer membrane beta-barrel protein [Nitrospirota bacterium]NTW66601.1 outer membrane beta-barrel protein [Nitrospirota bacterium]